MTKLINKSSLFQHSFLFFYFNGNMFLLHIYIIPFGYWKSQTKSNYFRSNCDLILDLTTFQKKSHQKFRSLDRRYLVMCFLWRLRTQSLLLLTRFNAFQRSKYMSGYFCQPAARAILKLYTLIFSLLWENLLRVNITD